MKSPWIGSALALAAALPGASEAAPRMSARAIPDFRLACVRYGRDHAAVKNVGRTSVPGGTRIRLTAAGGRLDAPNPAFGELHAALKPGATWSSIARLPEGFATCEATVEGARPL